VTDGHGAFFLAGDQVAFGNGSVGNVAIAAAGVSPDAVFVQNASGNYTFSGGSITGAAKLEKSGAGTLTLANDNTYAGDTNILGGVLALDAQGQIGTSSLIANAATFRILAGNHAVGTIRGTGTTEVLAGSLTAISITQDTLVIGSGGKMSLSALSSAASANDNPAVPEPSISWLFITAMSSFFVYRLGHCGRK
jgi:autotransporter-associated beta strand protein